MDVAKESWIERLSHAGPAQDDALAALRELLLTRLRRVFPSRAGADAGWLEDVTQEALLKTLEKLHQFEGRSRFTTWATTIAVRLAFGELRRRHWKDVSLEQHLDDGGQTVDSQQGELQQQELVRDMYRIIDTELTEKQRTALRAELKGMPLEEIGRRMGSNRNAVYKLTHDARKRLKSGLEQAGFSAADFRTSPR